jgi:hypothetical protein
VHFLNEHVQRGWILKVIRWFNCAPFFSFDRVSARTYGVFLFLAIETFSMQRFGLKHTTLALLFASVGWCAQASAADSDINLTGPLLTASPNVPSQGTWNIEPYLMYYKSADSYDDRGDTQAKDNSTHQWQTLVPITYSVTDRFMLTASVGMAHAMSAGMRTDGWGATDTSIGGQYQLLTHNEQRTTPALAVRYTHRFPTGSYDKLNENPLNATGNGAHVDTLSLLAQQYAWLPNGRRERHKRLRHAAGFSRRHSPGQCVRYLHRSGIQHRLEMGTCAGSDL